MSNGAADTWLLSIDRTQCLRRRRSSKVLKHILARSTTCRTNLHKSMAKAREHPVPANHTHATFPANRLLPTQMESGVAASLQSQHHIARSWVLQSLVVFGITLSGGLFVGSATNSVTTKSLR
ncbi:hypothetical protein BO85DRAFT_49912 [Aspergillus piperis CBS 112811]|uniref:Uncharacterized protein n=1 Tax=Aspergillus piperis CBS 112811 TaxID=1448313 RepID=A0A8G1VLH6_9EURO|nr:hypothetical protein BO85DRAFT_49912 [Aspergillus piperis CBS 112811]RAH56437.1 hypothetical protein BO85DRAFT_49912 [Aspergillus piperis CBS 112811]